jgi:hypothetical protein
MKKIILSITLVMAIVAFAFANQPTQTKFEPIEKHPLFGPLGNPEFETTAREAAHNARFAKPEAKPFDATQRFNRPQPVEEKVQKEVSLKSRMDELWPKFDRHNPEARNLGKSPTAKDYHRWDSIVLHTPDGSPWQVLAVTYQYIDGLYYPHLMTIRELPSRRLTSERYYDWHTEGNLKGKLKEQRVGELVGATTWGAEKVVFHHNAQGFEDTVYLYRASGNVNNLNWRLIIKEVHDYDANGNVVKTANWQELLDNNQPTGEWVVSSIGTFTWHADRTLKNRKVWGWDFFFPNQRAQWIGIEEETEWFMGSNRRTLAKSSFWEFTNDANATDVRYLTDYGVPTEGIFVPDREVKYDFILSPFGPLRTLESWSYYNPTNDNWLGDPDNMNRRNRIERRTYDPAHNYRQTGETAVRLTGPNPETDWTATHGAWTEIWNWSQNPNTDPDREWEWEVAIHTLMHGPLLHWDPPLLSGEDRVFRIDSFRFPRFVDHYSSHSGRIALRYKVLANPDTEYESGEEHFFKFDKNNKNIEWKIFEIVTEAVAALHGVPTRFGSYWETIERDECGNLTISRHHLCKKGHVGEDFDDWVLTNKWVYEQTCDGFTIYKMGYLNEEMTIPWLSGCRELFMNYDIPVSDMIVWEDRYGDPAVMSGDHRFPYLVEQLVRFEGFNATTLDDIEEYVETYHYTIVTVDPASNQGVVIEGQKATVTVFPNPVQDVLYIQTEDKVQQIYVFDLNGRMVKQVNGDQKSIDLSTLPTGHYVARIHTDKAVVPVRVVKQ